MKLGIIGAMDMEVETLVSLLEMPQARTHAGSVYHSGKLEGLDVVVVQCGIGKVNAGLCVQVLADCYGVTHVVNTGIAGSLSPALDIGDFVISRDAMYHDVDCVHFGYTMGQLPGMDVRFAADEKLVQLALEAAEAIHPGHSTLGTVASGDQFVAEKNLKEKIIAITGGLCTEMEGAAIAQAASRNGIPFVIIRAISDKADDSAQMDYPVFERLAAHRCAGVTQAFAKALKETE